MNADTELWRVEKTGRLIVCRLREIRSGTGWDAVHRVGIADLAQ